MLPADEYPQFDELGRRPLGQAGRPVRPAHRQHYVYSQIADVSYKRLTREITVPATGGVADVLDLVRHRAGLGLPVRRGADPGRQRLDDAAGRERPHHARHRAELPGRLADLHPQLDHYQTYNGADCTPTGTTGAWNAASGNSSGWQQWSIDLAATPADRGDLDLLRQRLEHPGPRRVPRRLHAARRLDDVVRDRSRRLVDHRSA